MGRSRVLVVLCGAVLAASAAAAHAAPVVDGVFAVADTPGKLTQGPDGNMWAIVGSGLARITPAGAVTPYPLALTSPKGIVAGPDGNLWVTRAGGVERIPPANPAGRTPFAIAAIVSPQEIVVGPDGALWTGSDDKVVRIPVDNPAGATTTTITGMGARGIASSGGQLWVVDFAGAKVHAVTPGGGVTAYDVGGNPQEITAGPGGEVLYTNPAPPHRVGRILAGQAPRVTPVAPASDPFGATLGADGAYWFTEFNAQKLGRLAPDGTFSELEGLPPASGPRWIASGPQNTLWVSLETTKQIARVTGVDPPPAPTPPAPPPPAAEPGPTQQGLPAGTTPRAPARPSGTFTLDRRAKTVTVRVRRVTGVRYALRATRPGTRARTGVCHASGARVVCRVKLSRGAWRVAVTPRRDGVAGPTLRRTVRVR